MLDLSPAFFNVIPKRDRITDVFQFGDDIELGAILRGVNIDNENILGEKQVSIYNRAINPSAQATDVVDRSITAPKIALLAITDAHIANLNADKINAGTITGRTFRTAASGMRIEMDVVEHDLLFFTPDGIKRAHIDLVGTDLRIRSWQTGNDINFFLGLNGVLFLRGNKAGISGNPIDIVSIFANEMQCNHIFPIGNVDLGRSTHKWLNFWRTNEFACDLPTASNAIKIFRRIKKPTKKISKERKHFGEDREYFKIEDFPEEMKAENDKKELDIEMTRTLGVCVEAIKEIIEEIDKLKLGYELRGKKTTTN